MLADNRKARNMDAQGRYTKQSARGKALVNSQEVFYQMAKEAAAESVEPKNKSGFQPATHKNELSD